MKKLIRTSLAALTLLTASFCAFAAGDKNYVKQEINASDRCLPTFYENIKNRWTFSMGYQDGVDPVQWKNDGLAKARELIIQNEDNTPFDMVVLETEKRDGYEVQKIAFSISQDSRIPAYLLVPKGKKGMKYPAALMLHDHGANFFIGKEKMVRAISNKKVDKVLAIKDAKQYKEELKKLSPEDKKLADVLKRSDGWAKTYFSDLYPGEELAKRGYVVLSFDALGWGDRSVDGFNGGSQQSLASNLFNMGTSFAGIIAQEDVRAAKFLADLPQVDKTKVACIGFSMGGFRSWQLAALSDDITAAISVCWFGTMKGHIIPDDGQLKGASAFSMLHPTIAKFLDYPDVAGLAAPKPMYFVAGTLDGVNPVAGTNEAFEKVHKIWTANNADKNLKTEMVEGMYHEYKAPQQKATFDWLDSVFAK